MKKTILWFIFLFLILLLGYFVFLIYKFNRLEKKINPSSENQSIFSTLKSITSEDESSLKSLQGYSSGRINILLLGIGGKGNPGQNLTDTIMLASINLEDYQVALFSIPRDFFVTIPETNVQTKINTIYQYGLSRFGGNSEKAANLVEKTIENMTSLQINYYAILNFEGFKKVINSIGGINISNDRDIYDSHYPGGNYSYEIFELKKGFHHMDGELALKYARERHDDPEGDFGRAKRQQQILEATKEKVFSAGTIFNVLKINNLFNELGDNVFTDIRPKDAAAFFELTKKLDTRNINNVVLDAWNKESLLKVSHVTLKEKSVFILIPRIGNFSEIEELAQNIFDLRKIEKRKETIRDENAQIAIINQSGDSSLFPKIKKLLTESFNYKNVNVLNYSDRNTNETTLAYDLTLGNKPFTLDEIATKLPSSVSYELPDYYQKALNKNSKNYPDIVIVIGKDLVSKYSRDEDSIEDFKKADDNQNYLDLINQNNYN